MKCCGLYGADDWLQYTGNFPKSCCENEQTLFTKQMTWKTGCKSQLVQHFQLMAIISASLSIFFGVIQVNLY